MSRSYQIPISAAAGERIRATMDESERVGREVEATRAPRWIVEELERTPSEFGESRKGSDSARLQMRIAFVKPLRVRFDVHEPSKRVFVQGIWFENR